jgi:hypothetical protein
MTERIGETKSVQNYRINPPVYMGLDGFANTLHAFQFGVVEHAKGFLYASISSSNSILDGRSKFIEICNIRRTFYTPSSCCKEFLVIKDDGHACLEDNIAKNSYHGVFKIVKLEDYQLGDMEKVILNSIEKSESIRKSKS